MLKLLSKVAMYVGLFVALIALISDAVFSIINSSRIDDLERASDKQELKIEMLEQTFNEQNTNCEVLRSISSRNHKYSYCKVD